MTFCEGFKVTDAKALAAAELDREGVMRAVTESFAYQVITPACDAKMSDDQGLRMWGEQDLLDARGDLVDQSPRWCSR